MNILDILILLLAGLLVFNGVRKGLIISLATMIALILGIWAALHFSSYMGRFLENQFHPSGNWLNVLSFSLTFLVVIVIVLILAKGLEKLVNLTGMGLFNHLAGGILGLVKALILASVLIYIIQLADRKQKLITSSMKEKSFSYHYVEKVFPALMQVFGEKELKLQ